MNLSKIHHIAIIVSDYEATKDFYVKHYGKQNIRRIQTMTNKEKPTLRTFRKPTPRRS